jgi:outer membrane receptor protein involved in Fe transport
LNADSAESSGAEASFTALLTDQLTFSGAIGYLNTEFTDFTNSQVGDVTGLPLPNSPEWSSSGSLQYDWTAGLTNGYVRLVGAYKDSTFVRFQDIKQPKDSLYYADSYVVFNFGAGVTWGRNSFDLSINNLFDEEYIAGVDSTSSLGPVVLPHPRIWTLTWTGEFGE